MPWDSIAKANLAPRHLAGAKTMLDKLYLEIRDKWNELRLKDTDPDVLRFLVHLMDELEVMMDEPRQGDQAR